MDQNLVSNWPLSRIPDEANCRSKASFFKSMPWRFLNLLMNSFNVSPSRWKHNFLRVCTRICDCDGMHLYPPAFSLAQCMVCFQRVSLQKLRRKV